MHASTSRIQHKMSCDKKDNFLPAERDAIQELRNCLFHGNEHKIKFQSLLNVVRGKIIKEKYVKKLSCRICLCKVSGDYLEKVLPTEENDVQKIKESVSGKVLAAALESPDMENTRIEASMSDWDSLLQTIKANKSVLRLAYLIQQALKDDFLPMDPPRKPQGPRKPKLLVETFALPIKSSYVPFMIGKKGTNLQNIIKAIEDKDLQVQIVKSKDRSTVTDTTDCVIKTRSPEVMEKVKILLRKAAKETEIKRKLAEKKTVQYFKQKAENRKQREHENTIALLTPQAADAESMKEEKTETFAKKHDATKFDNRKSEATPKPPAVLEEGSRCINCLTHFEAEKLKDTTCKFHPGFIAEEEENVLAYEYSTKSDSIEVVPCGKKSVIISEKKWSCCGESAPDTTKADQEESHAATGCTVGAHNFRPTKKADNRPGKRAPSMKQQKGDKNLHAGAYSHQDSVTSEYDEAGDAELEEEYAPPKFNPISLVDLIQKK